MPMFNFFNLNRFHGYFYSSFFHEVPIIKFFKEFHALIYYTMHFDCVGALFANLSTFEAHHRSVFFMVVDFMILVPYLKKLISYSFWIIPPNKFET